MQIVYRNPLLNWTLLDSFRLGDYYLAIYESRGKASRRSNQHFAGTPI